jgi:metal-sulfur cluster biosynthetic enzyme
MSVDLASVREAAGGVLDPEIRRSISDMGLLDDVTVDEGGRVTVRYHLTSPLCPSAFAVQIGKEMRQKVEAIDGVTACEVLIQDHFIGKEIQRLVNTDTTDADRNDGYTSGIGRGLA